MNILLIDDEESILYGITNALEHMEMNVTGFSKPNKAVLEYKRNNYDVVISDLKMSGMDGIKVMSTIFYFDPKPLDLKEVMRTLREIEQKLS